VDKSAVIGLQDKSDQQVNSCQMACKPGSVQGVTALGWPFLWDARRRTPRATYPRIWCGRHLDRLPGPILLSGLAPGGVCRAGAVTGTAVRSYRTVSPLPRPRKTAAVCSLWHCP